MVSQGIQGWARAAAIAFLRRGVLGPLAAETWEALLYDAPYGTVRDDVIVQREQDVPYEESNEHQPIEDAASESLPEAFGNDEDGHGRKGVRV